MKKRHSRTQKGENFHEGIGLLWNLKPDFDDYTIQDLQHSVELLNLLLLYFSTAKPLETLSSEITTIFQRIKSDPILSKYLGLMDSLSDLTRENDSIVRVVLGELEEEIEKRG